MAGSRYLTPRVTRRDGKIAMRKAFDDTVFVGLGRKQNC